MRTLESHKDWGQVFGKKWNNWIEFENNMQLCTADHTAENGLARKDPSGQLSAWKLRDDLRRRLFKQISRHASDKQGKGHLPPSLTRLSEHVIKSSIPSVPDVANANLKLKI